MQSGIIALITTEENPESARLSAPPHAAMDQTVH